MRKRSQLGSFIAGIALSTFVFATSVSETMIDAYTSQTGQAASARQGEVLWMSQNEGRRCSDCHGADLTKAGKHIRTKKVIDPMAPSVNTTRLRDKKNIEKWFKRNCLWTLKRECTPQEKANILAWLASQ